MWQFKIKQNGIPSDVRDEANDMINSIDRMGNSIHSFSSFTAIVETSWVEASAEGKKILSIVDCMKNL